MFCTVKMLMIKLPDIRLTMKFVTLFVVAVEHILRNGIFPNKAESKTHTPSRTGTFSGSSDGYLTYSAYFVDHPHGTFQITNHNQNKSTRPGQLSSCKMKVTQTSGLFNQSFNCDLTDSISLSV